MPARRSKEFTSAVHDSPDFAAAWARLSDAEFTAGGDRSLNANFQSVSSEKATQRAIDAGEEAIRRGATDLLLRTNLGFFHFTLGQLDQAEALSQSAVGRQRPDRVDLVQPRRRPGGQGREERSPRLVFARSRHRREPR